MCDYSLHAVKSRPATVGDKLSVTCFLGTGTKGLSAPDSVTTAVCLMPGTEVALADGRLARFRQLDVDKPLLHHDALEFADGKTVRINNMEEGVALTVLQLPATEKPAADKAPAATVPREHEKA